VWIFSGFLFLVQFLFPCFFCKKRRKRSGNFVEKKGICNLQCDYMINLNVFKSMKRIIDVYPFIFIFLSLSSSRVEKTFCLDDKMKNCVSYK